MADPHLAEAEDVRPKLIDRHARQRGDFFAPMARHNLPFVNRLGLDAEMARGFGKAANRFDSFLARDDTGVIDGKSEVVSHRKMKHSD